MPPEVRQMDAPSDWLGRLRQGGVNTAAGLQYSREDAAFYRQVVEKFMGDYEKNCKKLSEFYREKDMENYRISVHALKSTSKMIGADVFSGKAKAAEDAAKNLDTAYLDTHHGALLDAYGQLINMLKAALEEDASTDGQATTGTAVSKEEQCGGLSELANCLKTFEADRAEEILKKLCDTVCDEQDVSEILSEIRSDIDDFEMDAAEKKVQELILQLKGGEA